MTTTPTPDPAREREPVPYATPNTGRESERTNALIMIVLLQCVTAGGIFWIAGASWPAVAALAILAAVVIAMGHFITRRPI
jgi:ABC-type multidrug transport system permease subunit